MKKQVDADDEVSVAVQTFKKKPSKEEFLATPVRTPAQMREVKNTRKDTPADISERIYEAIGHKDLVESFVHTGDDRYVELARSLLDGKHDNSTFQQLYKRVGLTSLDVIEAFRRYKLDQAIINIHQEIPTVSKDLMEDAKSYPDLCPRCQGLTTVQVAGKEEECPRCKGHGIIKMKGDSKAREMAFKATGIIQDKVISINQNFGPMQPMDQVIVGSVIDLPSPHKQLKEVESEYHDGEVGGSGEAVEEAGGLYGVDIEGTGVDSGPGEGEGGDGGGVQGRGEGRGGGVDGEGEVDEEGGGGR
jgi:hypothetical protein